MSVERHSLRSMSMSSYNKFLLTVTVCFYLTMPVLAQTNGGTPEAVVQNYWAAMQAAEWAKCADMIHPQSLRKIRKSSDRFGMHRFALARAVQFKDLIHDNARYVRLHMCYSYCGQTHSQADVACCSFRL